MGWSEGGSGCPFACALGGGFAPRAGIMDGGRGARAEQTRSEEAAQPLEAQLPGTGGVPKC